MVYQGERIQCFRGSQQRRAQIIGLDPIRARVRRRARSEPHTSPQGDDHDYDNANPS